MIPFFPKQIAQRAILVYVVALTAVSLFFMTHAMGIGYIALGCLWVVGFFSLLVYCCKKWLNLSDKQVLSNVFLTALALRIFWVVFSYFFYDSVTGQPFEFQARDSYGYHTDAEWLAGEPWSTTWSYLFGSVV